MAQQLANSQVTGLADTLEIITDPHTRREVDFPVIQLSDGFYHWRDFLGVIFDRWTWNLQIPQPGPSPARVNGKVRETQSQISVLNLVLQIRIPVIEFVNLMCDPRFIYSMTSSAQQVYFLSSLANWRFEFVRWVAPTIRSMVSPELFSLVFYRLNKHLRNGMLCLRLIIGTSLISSGKSAE